MVDRLPEAELINSDFGKQELLGIINDLGEIFVCDNVTKYFYEESDKEYWNKEDFPLFVPPYPVMWVESRKPEKIVSEKYGVNKADNVPKSWGVLMLSTDDPELKNKAIEYHRSLPVPPHARKLQHRKFNFEDAETADRITQGYLFIEFKQYEVVMCSMFSIWSDNDGRIIGWDFASKWKDEEEAMYAEALLNAVGAESWGFDNLVYPALLTVSFSNCKNVQVVQRHPDTKFSKICQKKTGRQLKPYKMVQIHPVQKVAEERHQGIKTGIVRALHICRGHFAHYGEAHNKGKLFGKYEGTFWISPHTRGQGEPAKQRTIYNVHSK